MYECLRGEEEEEEEEERQTVIEVSETDNRGEGFSPHEMKIVLQLEPACSSSGQ